MSTKVDRIQTKEKHQFAPKALSNIRKYFPKVKEVEDGVKPITIDVRKADSNSAAVRNHESCAMAVACKRIMKADGVIIAISTAYIVKGDRAYRYEVPQAVQREIVSFDREAGFAPGQYELIPFSEGQRLGVRLGRKGPHDNRTGRAVNFRHVTTGIRSTLGSDVVA